MSDSTGSPFDSRRAHRQCVKIVLNSITRAEVNETAVAEFATMFFDPFDSILTAAKGRRRWELHGEHVRSLARLLGMLAEFYALRNPLHPETVGRDHLVWALKILKNECRLDLPDESGEATKPSHQKFIYCDVPV